MRNLFHILPTAAFLFFIALPVKAASPLSHPQVQTRSTADLKPYMAKFGSMLAGLEIIHIKEKTPDWAAIDISVKELNETVAEMQQADKDKAYKEFTDVLAGGMVELKDKSAKRDKGFFRSLEKLSDTCFKCHAAHRPGDYLVPSKDKKQLSQDHAK